MMNDSDKHVDINDNFNDINTTNNIMLLLLIIMVIMIMMIITMIMMMIMMTIIIIIIFIRITTPILNEVFIFRNTCHLLSLFYDSTEHCCIPTVVLILNDTVQLWCSTN